MNLDKAEEDEGHGGKGSPAPARNWQHKHPQHKESSGNEVEPQGLLIKTKQTREIYKPPNLRKSRTAQFQNNGGNGRSKGHQYFYYFQAQPYSLPLEQHSNAATGVDHRQKAEMTQPLNFNAREFQANSQKRHYWSTFDQSEPEIRRDPFPLVQSKSANSMFAQFQKHCQQLEEQQRQQQTENSNETKTSENAPKLEPTNEATPPNNNGNVKGRVRFLEQAGNNPLDRQMEALKIGVLPNSGQPKYAPEVGLRKPHELVRSKSMIHRNAQVEWCAVSPPFNRKLWDAFHPQYAGPGQPQIWTPDWLSPGKAQPAQETKKVWTPGGGIKRSKSFGCKTAQVQPLFPVNSGTAVATPLMTPNWDDFQLSKWPKGVVEPVTMAINGVERVPARHKIDMVTRMFGTMLGDYESTLTLGQEEHKTLSQFILPAVNIFLYFIQREPDETVLESFLNNSLMTYQSLCQGSKVNSKKLPNGNSPLSILSMSTTSKWIIFLQLLSTFYQKTKVIRGNRQRSVEKFGHRILSLLCDSAIIVIRLSPISYTTELVDTLFTVMTSLGRDMETKFPMKLKEILAGVRDVLLGVSVPAQNAQDGPSAQVHKTLMQLIELHAANWQLPASAVRYYYANQSQPAQET